MGHQAFISTINLLSTIRPDYQELLLLDKLNSAFNFDHNVFLLHSSVDTNRFINETKWLDPTPRSLHTFENFDDSNSGDLEKFRRYQGKNEFLIVASANYSFEGTLQLLSFVKKIHLLNVNVKIGVFFSHVCSNDDLQNLFRWFGNNRIIGVFVAFIPDAQITQESQRQLLNVFIFDPFGTFDVINLTGIKNVVDIFPVKKINLHQHQFRVALIDDESIIKYSTKIPFFGGPDGNTWNAVFELLNASYSIFWVRKRMLPVEMLDDGRVDLSLDLTESTEQRTVTVYPLIMEILLVVVPKALPFSAFEALMSTLTSNLSIYFLIVIAVVVFVLTVARYIRKKQILFFECALDVFNLLMNDNYRINYSLLTHSEILLIVPLTLVGFFFVNGFSSNLKSHLTRPIMQYQVDTAEDLYNSPLPYAAYNEFWIKKETKLLDNVLKRGDWSNRMILVNSSETKRRINQNAAISFSEYEFMAKLMAKHKKYHVTQIELQWIWFSYNARYDFPFIDRINEIILWVRMTGLYDKWRNYEIGVLESLYKGNDSSENALEILPVPMFIVYGYIAGVVVIIIEIIFKKYQLRRG